MVNRCEPLQRRHGGASQRCCQAWTKRYVTRPGTPTPPDADVVSPAHRWDLTDPGTYAESRESLENRLREGEQMAAVSTAGAPSTCGLVRNPPWKPLPPACILAAGAYREGRGESASEPALLVRGITIHGRVTTPFYRGLSRMRGNLQVRFLGGREAERSPAYPARLKDRP
jgi:hypothetical protein